VGSELLLLPVFGLFGIHISFRHPFGKHSLFHKAMQIASALPLPGSGVFGAASKLFNRGKNAYTQLQGMVAPVRTTLVAATAPIGVMPGGTRAGSPPRRRASTTHRKRGKRRRRRL
jgi:hypothetical protein